MYRNLLLTGATGALGPHLAAELLATEAADRISVLVRPATAPARTRFVAWLKTVSGILSSTDREAEAIDLTPNPLDRLHPVVGDISHEGLRLEASEDVELRRDVEVIIHAAADTRFIAPAGDQWDANVEGTRRMLDWATRCPRLRRFILVSSAYVAGSQTGRIFEHVSGERPEFVPHYQRTKWEAERLAVASGLPVSIARVSLIMGSHATGFVHRPGALHNLIRWFGRGLLPVLPGTPETTVDLIAAETAARFLARAASSDVADAKAGSKEGPPIWHIAAGCKAARLSDLIDFVFAQFCEQPGWARKQIAKARVVDRTAFERLCKSAAATDHAGFAQVMGSVGSFLPDLLYPKTYDTTRAEALWGGSLPLPDSRGNRWRG